MNARSKTTVPATDPVATGGDASKDMQALVAAYRTAIIPHSFEYWCNMLCQDEGREMEERLHALFDAEDARRAGDEDYLSRDEEAVIKARVKAALSAPLQNDLSRLLTSYLSRGNNRADVLFRVGMAIGGAR